MNLAFYQQIANSTAHRKSREGTKNFLVNNPEYLKFLLEIAFNTNDKNDYKAVWIIDIFFIQMKKYKQLHNYSLY